MVSDFWLLLVVAAVLLIVVAVPVICSMLDDGPNPLAKDNDIEEDADFFL
ncbi:MAG: hypothetical protein IJ852_05355 [Alphaproteobacteria bacterium]|nr:hypothetical protein [Alphaproteobacteria bacterium]